VTTGPESGGQTGSGRPVPSPPVTATLADKIASIGWYHTLELDGAVTPGWYDLRSVAGKVPIPDDLSGKRCLDVGTCDGFWAFRIEQRGADEVVAVDLDDPALRDWQGPPAANPDDRRDDLGRSATAFGIAREVYGSSVQRVDCNVYDLRPERVGTFDFAFIGSLLLHLRDPVGALMAIRRVLKPEGTLLSFDSISLKMTALAPRTPAAELWNHGITSWWWTPNLAAYKHYFPAAGFDIVRSGGPLLQRFGEGHPTARRKKSSLARRVKSEARRALGAPSAWVLARPTP
jgi:tRNA (mo5U34)-methyltransferase